MAVKVLGLGQWPVDLDLLVVHYRLFFIIEGDVEVRVGNAVRRVACLAFKVLGLELFGAVDVLIARPRVSRWAEDRMPHRVDMKGLLLGVWLSLERDLA